LKAKRRELAPVKAYLQGCLGGTVSEIGHQDLWQRATVLAAFAAGSTAQLEAVADTVQRWLDGRFVHGARMQLSIASVRDLQG
jgi:uncharacterized protein YlxP (DUF503 family)